MKKLLIGLICSFSVLDMIAQSTARHDHVNEISFNLDNDVLMVLDRYYTAGQDITYRRVLKSGSFLQHSDSSKVLIHFRYGNKMFTPTNIKYSDVRYMDRPYCGWSFVSTGFTRFRNQHSADQLEIEAGIVGPNTRMEELQKWWHKLIGFGLPKGWASQIKEEKVLNFNYHFARAFRLRDEMDLISTTGFFAGTGNNKITQEIVFRAGDINPLSQSTFFNGRLGSRAVKHYNETFIFFGVELDYVISNIFLEGSLFKSNPSPFTLDANPFLLKQKVGLMHSLDRGSFILSLNFLSKEWEIAKRHCYATMLYAYRF